MSKEHTTHVQDVIKWKKDKDGNEQPVMRYEAKSFGDTLDMSNSLSQIEGVYAKSHSPKKAMYVLDSSGVKKLIKKNYVN